MEIFATHIIYVFITFAAGVIAGWATYWSMQRLRRRLAERVSNSSVQLNVNEITK